MHWHQVYVATKAVRLDRLPLSAPTTVFCFDKHTSDSLKNIELEISGKNSEEQIHRSVARYSIVVLPRTSCGLNFTQVVHLADSVSAIHDQIGIKFGIINDLDCLLINKGYLVEGELRGKLYYW